MIGYFVRRFLHAPFILLAVNILTFMMFFYVVKPDDIARAQLGMKHVTPVAIAQWKQAHGYDAPLFWNPERTGRAHITQTLFYQKTVPLLHFDLGENLNGYPIADEIHERMGPSLMIAVPSLFLGLLTYLSVAFVMLVFQRTRVFRIAMMSCVILMSISGMFYIVFGQFVMSLWLKWFPLSGFYEGGMAWHFVSLPILISVVSGLGASVRWYHTMLVEAYHQPFILTAKAKGLGYFSILRRHVLPNAMIPIATQLVAVIPLLFMGSLLLESFFGIPGLGSYTIDAIAHQDFEIIRVMVFIGACAYLIGLWCTDIAYLWLDPRVRLS